MEEFKDFKYGYKVSNHGRVLNRYEVELKCSITNRGYRYFQIQKNNKRKNYFIHRVIGLLFMGERPKEDNGKDYVIDHIDRNKLNNHIDNLRYITHKDNLRNSDKYVDEITEEDPVLRKRLMTKRYNKLHEEEVKQKNREYCNNNREVINQKHKEYYKNNKEKKKEYGSKIITCDVCNVSFRQDSRSKHLKTKLHQGNIYR